ncbi:MAG: 23S rRNA (adenine(2503)-C(2))-methyltransferase RlmN [bacterium]|nr:23S rRNA (adenine(2503)-C(2))-methyltransferase RlmN [bacterium]MDD5756414.1 23S rRNA (adenine(2503)-C(2))-methyltransferase RlmN [bacterium]
MPFLKEYSLPELKEDFKRLGLPGFRANQVFHWLYKKGARHFAEMNNLPKEALQILAENYELNTFTGSNEYISQDGSRKYLLKLVDSNQVEAVFIPAGERNTLCVSTQVGCKFSCGMCASGLKSFVRHLTAGEIIDQLLYVQRQAKSKITNIVFMGMGEPLENYANVSQSIRLINSQEGPGIAARRITISTAGYLPGIAKLSAFDCQVNLSLSLHATTDEQRSKLMPINKKYPFKEVLKACADYFQKTSRIVTLEYILLRGFNDTLADAQRLVTIARDLKGKVNLLPFNPFPALKYKPVSQATMEQFEAWLKNSKVPVTIRESRGADIYAACGQLAANIDGR